MHAGLLLEQRIRRANVPMGGPGMRGAARNLTTETGTGLAGFVEDSFEAGTRPSVRAHMSESDVARYGAEGAAMTVDEAIAYALEGAVGGAAEDGPPAGTAG